MSITGFSKATIAGVALAATSFSAFADTANEKTTSVPQKFNHVEMQILERDSDLLLESLRKMKVFENPSVYPKSCESAAKLRLHIRNKNAFSAANPLFIQATPEPLIKAYTAAQEDCNKDLNLQRAILESRSAPAPAPNTK